MSEVVPLITFLGHMSSLPVFGEVRVVHLFGFLCCVFGGIRVAHLFGFLCCVFGGIRVAHLFGFLCYVICFVCFTLCLLLNISGLSILFYNVYSSNSLIKILNLNLQLKQYQI